MALCHHTRANSCSAPRGRSFLGAILRGIRDKVGYVAMLQWHATSMSNSTCRNENHVLQNEGFALHNLTANSNSLYFCGCLHHRNSRDQGVTPARDYLRRVLTNGFRGDRWRAAQRLPTLFWLVPHQVRILLESGSRLTVKSCCYSAL